MRKKKETLLSLNLIRIFTLCSLKIRMTWQHVFVVYNLQSEKKFLQEIRSIRMLIGNFIHQICHMINNLKIMFLRSLFWWLFHIDHTPFIIELVYYANECTKKRQRYAKGIPVLINTLIYLFFVLSLHVTASIPLSFPSNTSTQYCPSSV